MVAHWLLINSCDSIQLLRFAILTSNVCEGSIAAYVIYGANIVSIHYIKVSDSIIRRKLKSLSLSDLYISHTLSLSPDNHITEILPFPSIIISLLLYLEVESSRLCNLLHQWNWPPTLCQEEARPSYSVHSVQPAWELSGAESLIYCNRNRLMISDLFIWKDQEVRFLTIFNPSRARALRINRKLQHSVVTLLYAKCAMQSALRTVCSALSAVCTTPTRVHSGAVAV